MHANMEMVLREYKEKFPDDVLLRSRELERALASEVAEAREIMLQILRTDNVKMIHTLATVFLQVPRR